MRCEKCGAEIGDARVCSFCDTPRRNVLVGDNVIQGFKTSNVMHAPINLMDKDINSGTTVLETYDEVEQVFIDEEKNINAKEILKNEDSSKKGKSVIPDYSVKNHKKWNRKKKIITIISLVITGLIIIFGVFVLYTYRQFKKYVDGLKKSMICFVEIDADSLDTYYYIDDNDEVVQFKSEDFFLDDDKEKTVDFFVVSSGNMFAAYQISDSYEVSDDLYNRSEGEEKITIYTYELYLQKRDGESIRMLHEEKKDGEIELIGVTDNGDIIYNDTDKKKSMMVSNSGIPTEIGGMLSEGVFYKNGSKALLQQDGQLLVSSVNYTEECIIVASNVSGLIYMDGDDQSGYLRSCKQPVTSTDSEASLLIYRNDNDEYYSKDINSTKTDSKKIDIKNYKIDDLELYNADLNIVDMSLNDISGSGKLIVTKQGIIYKLNLYRNNLGKADKVLALDGRNVYLLRNGKTIRIDVFNKKQKVLFDREMKIKLRFR